MQSKNFQKKSHSPEKNPSEKHQRGTLVWFRGPGRRCFCFGRGSGVSSMFWMSVVQVYVVEQMNKKVDHTRLKNKTTHCNSRAHFLLKCTD